MASLKLTFSEVYTKVSEFLGLGSSPTGTDLTKVKDITHRAYRQFLLPTNLRTGVDHKWSFLKQPAKLITESDKWMYGLPSDFSKLITPFTFEVNTSYPGLTKNSVGRILARRNASNSSSFPSFYAIRAGLYVKEVGQNYEALFYPIPNGVYTLEYTYEIEPPKLVEDTDVFIGGVVASEVMLEKALSIAEQQEDDIIGIHSQLAAELMQKLIEKDDVDTSDYLGKMRGSEAVNEKYLRPLPALEDDVYE